MQAHVSRNVLSSWLTIRQHALYKNWQLLRCLLLERMTGVFTARQFPIQCWRAVYRRWWCRRNICIFMQSEIKMSSKFNLINHRWNIDNNNHLLLSMAFDLLVGFTTIKLSFISSSKTSFSLLVLLSMEFHLRGGFFESPLALQWNSLRVFWSSNKLFQNNNKPRNLLQSVHDLLR